MRENFEKVKNWEQFIAPGCSANQIKQESQNNYEETWIKRHWTGAHKIGTNLNIFDKKHL